MKKRKQETPQQDGDGKQGLPALPSNPETWTTEEKEAFLKDRVEEVASLRRHLEDLKTRYLDPSRKVQWSVLIQAVRTCARLNSPLPEWVNEGLQEPTYQKPVPPDPWAATPDDIKRWEDEMMREHEPFPNGFKVIGWKPVKDSPRSHCLPGTSQVAITEPDPSLFQQWVVAQNVKDAQQVIEAGKDGFAVLWAVDQCFSAGLMAPDWLVKAFQPRFKAVANAKAGSWDDEKAFGKPFAGKHLDRLEDRRFFFWEVFFAVEVQRGRGRKTGSSKRKGGEKTAFEAAKEELELRFSSKTAKELGLPTFSYDKDTVRKIYYEARKTSQKQEKLVAERMKKTQSL